MVGGLFAYFRKDLDSIRPEQLSQRVSATVTKYYDRRGPAGGADALLWEDKGDGDYKLVVDGSQINPLMKKATVAIEDKDFYKHGGSSITGIIRAVVNNYGGGSTQGGSTLTQQLVKQVFFSDEAQQRGLAGVPRKIESPSCQSKLNACTTRIESRPISQQITVRRTTQRRRISRANILWCSRQRSHPRTICIARSYS